MPSLSARITRSPRAFDPEMGARARELVPEAGGAFAELITGAGGSAPYLFSLLQKEGAWLWQVSDDPEAGLSDVIEGLESIAPDDLKPRLRQAKARIALLTAICDLGGVWSLEQVTGALSTLADRATHVSLSAEVGREILRGKIPGLTEADIETCGGVSVLAMGKHGAGELNYSSDIDLICLFDEKRFDRDDQMEARAGFIRATKRAMANLSEPTGDGYVFRTDLRLRPDPSVTPICFAMEAAERYYETLGRTWERAAFIKARAAAGDIEAGNAFLERLQPFVWRKHLDFHAIQETQDMRLKIREHKGFHGPIVLEDHNVKLGRGGIREIEFFAQTEQLITGGRNAGLRERATVPALAKLSASGWVSEDTATHLTNDYRDLRELEHRLQMLRDAQTHSLPQSDAEFERLAALMGVDVAPLRAELMTRFERVHRLTEGFFAPQTDDTVAPEIDDAQRAIVDRWPTYPCMRSERATQLFDRLRPEILRKINEIESANDALQQFDHFLGALPAGVQLFALFDANPELLDLILDIIATAPELGRYLARNGAVLDGVLDGSFFGPWPETRALTAIMSAEILRARDYEGQLDMARRVAKEWHFRVSVHLLRGLISARDAGHQYCAIARASVAALYPAVVDEFAKKHGAPPGKGTAILAMGSLGAGRLTASSDLDMIVIYDADGVENSDGPRPLDARSYYTRFTQSLITAITTQTAEGRLYEVDMRLRPSGKQGPVATSRASFEAYQRNEAWVWEHLALTRGCVIAGDDAIYRAVREFREGLIAAPKDVTKIITETRDMRARLAQAKPGSTWDPKNGAGRMMDIELLAECAALIFGETAQDVRAQLDAGHAHGWLSADQCATLKDSYALFWRLQSAARLLTGDRLDPDTAGAGGRAFLLRANDVPTIEALKDAIEAQAKAASDVISARLENAPSTS